MKFPIGVKCCHGQDSLLENMWLDHCVNHSFCGGTIIVGF